MMNKTGKLDEQILAEMLIEEVQSTPHFFLTDACERGDIKEARRLLESGVSFRDGGCWYFCFLTAVEKDNREVIHLLMEYGLDLSCFNAVIEAIRVADDPSFLEFLTTQGADPARRKKGWGVLQYSARYGRQLTLESLIEECELDPCEFDMDGKTLLMLTALSRETDHGASPALEYLLHVRQIDVNAQDDDGQTALMRAAQYGFVRNSALLLQSGARPDIQDRNGCTALMLACAGAPHDEVLRGNPVVSDSPTRVVERELVDVVAENHIEIVRSLLASGARSKLKNAAGFTAIDYAHARGEEELVSLLWEAADDR